MVESVGSVVQSGTSHLEPGRFLFPRPARDAIGRSRFVASISRDGKVNGREVKGETVKTAEMAAVLTLLSFP